ncbi:MAG: hypothetical protein QOG14_2906 [Mycobacterium sp.]|nr:hypothetical protein [Mycobacterium sp.]
MPGKHGHRNVGRGVGVADGHRGLDLLTGIGRDVELGQVSLRCASERIVDGVVFAHPVLSGVQLRVEVLQSILVTACSGYGLLEVVDVCLEFGTLFAHPLLVGVAFTLGRGQSLCTDRWAGIGRNSGVAVGHVDRGGQLLVDGVGFGENRVEPRLQLHFGDKRLCLQAIGARDHSVGHRVDRHVQFAGVAAQRPQVGLHVLDTVGGLVGGTSHRERLVAVGVEVLADAGVDVLSGLGGGAFPVIEHRQGAQLTRRLQRGLPASIRGLKHLAHRTGVPPINVGHRQRHDSGGGCTARNFSTFSFSSAVKSMPSLFRASA